MSDDHQYMDIRVDKILHIDFHELSKSSSETAFNFIILYPPPVLPLDAIFAIFTVSDSHILGRNFSNRIACGAAERDFVSFCSTSSTMYYFIHPDQFSKGVEDEERYVESN